MLAIDHLVLAAKDPEKAAQEYVERHGILAIEGGRHEDWGTYNFLAYFQNGTYLEWLGVFDEELAKKSDNPLIQKTVEFLESGAEGLVTYALRTKRMEDHIRHMETNQLKFKGPYPGARKKADGELLSWRMLFPEANEELPFLIEWSDEPNLPNDPANINPKVINEIRIPVQPERYEKSFGLEARNNIIEMENGRLVFTSDSSLQFAISNP